MVFLFAKKLLSILGVMTVIVELPKLMTARCQRKKYMGICSWESTEVRVMIARFPAVVSP